MRVDDVRGVRIVAALLACLCHGCDPRGSLDVGFVPLTRPDSIQKMVQVAPKPDLNSVAFDAGSNAVVAVGNAGFIAYSADEGASWAVASDPGIETKLNKVIATSSGRFVAVGDSGTIAYSADHGRTWARAVRSGISANLTNVFLAANDVLVAVGSGGTILRCRGLGDTWSSIASGTDHDLRAVAMTAPSATSPPIMVAIGTGGAIVQSRDGGASWFDASVAGVKSDLRDVVATPQGGFIAMGEDVILSSRDARTWNTDHEGLDGNEHLRLRSVVIGRNGEIVGIGQYILVGSTDGGMTWSVGDVTPHDSFLDLTKAAVTSTGTIVGVGSRSAARSHDSGRHWSPVTSMATDNTLGDVAALGPRTVIAVGEHGTIVRSIDDGQTWTRVMSWSPGNWYRRIVATSERGLVAVQLDGTLVHSADAGVTWSAATNRNPSSSLADVAPTSKPGVVVAVGGGGTVLRSTDDGATWASVDGHTSNALTTVVAITSTDVVVAVGDNGEIVRSANNGATWEHRSSGTDNVLAHVAVAPNGTLVAVGANGSILRSNDKGETWTPIANTGTSSALHHASLDLEGAWFAVGEDGAILRSSDDGTTWKAVKSATSSSLEQVVAGHPGAVIATSDGAGAVSSFDRGVTWRPVEGLEPRDVEKVARDGRQMVAVTANSSSWMLRSVDSGSTWSRLTFASDEYMYDVVLLPDGTIVAAGQSVFRSEVSHAAAPAIRKITSSYSMTGIPVLHIALADPEGLCADGKCLRIEGRSAAYEKLKQPPHELSGALSVQDRGEFDVTLEPSAFSSQAPDPLYVRVRLSVDGYTRMYPDQGAFYKVEDNPNPFYYTAWFETVMGLFAIALIIWLFIRFRPLWLLAAAARPELLDAAARARIPGLSELAVGLLRALLLPILCRNRRVLDAWVRAHSAKLACSFAQSINIVSDGGVSYVPLPIDMPGRSVAVPTPENLARLLDKPRVFVEIVGPGGVGKTKLAREIATWVFEGSLTPTPAAAIFVDEEFTELLPLVQAKLRGVLADQTPPAEFVRFLLRRGRLICVIDRLSERLPQTRDAVVNLYRTIDPQIVIATSRYPIKIDQGDVTEIRPRMLDSTTLLGFLGEQLRAKGALTLFPTIADQGVLVRRFARQITVDQKELPITPLLVSIFVSQAVQAASTRGERTGECTIDQLPESVPEVYFSYIEQLDATRRAADNPADRPDLARHAAALIAVIELGDDYRPKPVALKTIEAELATKLDSKIDHVSRMEACGLLVRRLRGTEAFIEYMLDPVAECLGAHEHAKRCGTDPARWQDLIDKVAALGRNAGGFLAALRMNHAAYAEAMKFPPVAFPADSDPSVDADRPPDVEPTAGPTPALATAVALPSRAAASTTAAPAAGS